MSLSEEVDIEIVNADSRQVYRWMDIGTSKPDSKDLERVRHHLIDIVDPDEDFSIERYLDAAHAQIAQIAARGREVLFVGGTPLYLKALLRGLSVGPPANWQLREQIEAEVAQVGNQALYERLRGIYLDQKKQADRDE